MSGGLFAVSDLHVDHAENRELVQRMYPDSPRDWLIVCGDVADDHADGRVGAAPARASATRG